MVERMEVSMERSRTSFFIITILAAGFFLSLSAFAAYGQWASTYSGLSNDYALSIQQTSDGGYIVAGYTNSLGIGDIDAWVMKLDSTGGVTWQKTYGGASTDTARTVWQTADGGYIVGGRSQSFGAGDYDAWVMKLDSTGGVTWQKTYGGAESNYLESVQQTADGGYIMVGNSRSLDNQSDVWIVKLDAVGDVIWQKTYGDVKDDDVYSIQQTQDGGYIVAGDTNSFSAGDYDAWVMKLDSTGGVTWQKTYGGAESESATSIQQTADGGYIVAGFTASSGAGDFDIWVMKLDSTGGVTWQKTYGGEKYDGAASILQTADGGYIVAGFTYSYGLGTFSILLIKLNGSGSVTWQKTFGGAESNYVYSVQQTQDGGYILAGGHNTSVGKNSDAFILKLDSSGSIGSCPFEGASTAVVSDTTVTGVDTTVVPADTAVTGVNTSATVNDASTIASQWCPLTEDTQRLKVGITPKKRGEGTIVSGEGLLSCPDKCQQEYNKGLTVTLYADPSDLSTFLGWKPTSLGCEGTDPCLVTMDKKKSVKAVFQGPNKLKVVTTFKNEAIGTVTSGDALINCPGDCEELYILDAPVTLTATAGANSQFVKWTGKPCKDKPTNVCTFTMEKNATVKAIFEPDP